MPNHPSRGSGHRPQQHRQGGAHPQRADNQNEMPAVALHGRSSAVTDALANRQNRCESWHLFLDKFSFQHWKDGIADKDKALKTESLKEVKKHYEAAKQNGKLLPAAVAAAARFLAALKKQHGDRFRVVELKNESKLLLHLGRSNVLENVGIYADRTTGLPVIPGTAFKGVLSTWTCWEANQNPDGSFRQGDRFSTSRESDAKAVFGDNSQNGSESSGEIVFVGAYPKTVPSLGMDIVNPHAEADGLGLEKRILTPNTFLCIEPGTTWQFVFFARPGTRDATRLLERVKVWTAECLTQFGLGAKTAAGYGIFADTDQSSQPTGASANCATAAGNPSSASPADTVIVKWKILSNSSNFRVALPEIAALDGEELKKAFDALIPQNERNRMKKQSPYWQAFANYESGKAILKKLGKQLQ